MGETQTSTKGRKEFSIKKGTLEKIVLGTFKKKICGGLRPHRPRKKGSPTEALTRREKGVLAGTVESFSLGKSDSKKNKRERIKEQKNSNGRLSGGKKKQNTEQSPSSHNPYRR